MENSLEAIEDIITIEDAEKILHIKREAIYAIKKNFTVRKPGKRLLFSRKELLAYVNGERKKAQ
jgi:hypothetical protein